MRINLDWWKGLHACILQCRGWRTQTWVIFRPALKTLSHLKYLYFYSFKYILTYLSLFTDWLGLIHSLSFLSQSRLLLTIIVIHPIFISWCQWSQLSWFYRFSLLNIPSLEVDFTSLIMISCFIFRSWIHSLDHDFMFHH